MVGSLQRIHKVARHLIESSRVRVNLPYYSNPLLASESEGTGRLLNYSKQRAAPPLQASTSQRAPQASHPAVALR